MKFLARFLPAATAAPATPTISETTVVAPPPSLDELYEQGLAGLSAAARDMGRQCGADDPEALKDLERVALALARRCTDPIRDPEPDEADRVMAEDELADKAVKPHLEHAVMVARGRRHQRKQERAAVNGGEKPTRPRMGVGLVALTSGALAFTFCISFQSLIFASLFTGMVQGLAAALLAAGMITGAIVGLELFAAQHATTPGARSSGHGILVALLVSGALFALRATHAEGAASWLAAGGFTALELGIILLFHFTVVTFKDAHIEYRLQLEDWKVLHGQVDVSDDDTAGCRDELAALQMRREARLARLLDDRDARARLAQLQDLAVSTVRFAYRQGVIESATGFAK